MKREEQDIMAATQWRQKVKNKEQKDDWKKRNRNRTNNPESQLVQFMSNATKGGGNWNKNGFNSRMESRFQVKSHLPVANEKSSPITIDNGEMVYIPKVKDDVRYIRCNHLSTNSKNQNGKESDLLGIPLSELIRRTEAIERKSMKRKRMRQERKNDADTTTERNGVDGNDERNVKDKDAQNAKHKANNSQLWVDKHAPKSFTDLLSDERTNREVLRALRQWDPFVFKKEPPKRPQSYVSYQNQKGSGGDGSTVNKNATNANEGSNKDKNDLRPNDQNRVILLSGPPGNFMILCPCTLYSFFPSF